MISDRLHEQACLYAAGALLPREAREIEEAMRHDPELRQLVEEMRDVGDSIAAGIPQVPPPAGMKQRLFAKLDSAAPGATVLAPDFRPVRRGTPLWVPLALAASFAILCALLVRDRQEARERTAELARQAEALQGTSEILEQQTQTVATQARQIAVLEQQLQTAANRAIALGTQMTALQNQVKQAETLRRDLDLANRRVTELSNLSQTLQQELGGGTGRGQPGAGLQITLLKSTSETTPEMAGVSIWDLGQQKGTFVAEKLPPLGDERQYQLWVLDPRYNSPVSAGVFSTDAEGRARIEFTPALQIASADRLAVSIERRGGSPTPQGRIVLLTQ